MTNGYGEQQHEGVAKELLSLARQHGLQFASDEAKVTESGMDFQVAMAMDTSNVDWVIRKPRRSDVLERAVNEKKVLDYINGRLPVNVPEWQVFSDELIAYPRLDGIPMADVSTAGYDWNINHEELKDEFVRSLAEALAALHAIDGTQAAAAGLRVKTPEEVRSHYASQAQEVKEKIGVKEELWDRWQAWLSDKTYWPDTCGLIHGDLHPPHILLDGEQRVTGLIDWTESEVADPATDFTIYYAIFGEDELQRMLTNYAAAGGKVWPRMKEHIVERYAAYPVLMGQFALLSGDEGIMTMARGALGLD
ncbi:macrolide 2'-phosphotransferase [Paenibacillus provencensis]|uniref:Macrolide 2'-phosphotransferase n=1 Tax=Paenibacillus provencensis TaxID=441151 RepID=A0ABW3PXW6_9BACL|nr:macrolide 2'-phosphotransferase [Paenibacillus sp. MER 78]MCM3128567.1 macrolide 2'-phosphotransferase [Paenibacillus sp. MER 78]